MQNNPKLSRRQKAKLRSQQVEVKEMSESFNEIQIKSVFSQMSNNPSPSQSLLDAFMQTTGASENNLIDIATKNSTVTTCMDIIATIVASTPMNLYVIQKDGTFKPKRGKRHVDHIFSKPNDADVDFTFKYKIVMYFLASGNCYLVKVDNQAFVLPASAMHKQQNGSYEARMGDKLIKDIDKKNVVQIFKPSASYLQASGGLKYFSTVYNALKDVVLNNEIMNHSTRQMKSGNMSRGVLTQDPDSSTPVSQAQMTTLSRQFTEATSGDKSTNTVMLPKGISYQPIQQSAVESGLLELLNNSRQNIVRAFKIPESIFNSEAGASYATANVQEVQFYKNTIRPICLLIESFLNQWDQVTSESEYFKFELGDMVSADEQKIKSETRYTDAQTLSTLKATNFMSPNQALQEAGYDKAVDSEQNPIAEADVNPLELGDLNDLNADAQTEPMDEESLVDEKSLKKKKSVKHGCKH